MPNMKELSDMTEEELTAQLLAIAGALGERGASACESAIRKLEESDDAYVSEFSAAYWEIIT